MPISATERAPGYDGATQAAGTPVRFPRWLVLLVAVEVALVLAVAALLLIGILSLARPTGGQIALMILAYAGVPLLLVACAAGAARTALRRHHHGIAVAVAILPLLLMAGALGVMATM